MNFLNTQVNQQINITPYFFTKLFGDNLYKLGKPHEMDSIIK